MRSAERQTKPVGRARRQDQELWRRLGATRVAALYRSVGEAGVGFKANSPAMAAAGLSF